MAAPGGPTERGRGDGSVTMSETTKFEQSLQEFGERFNGNERIRKLIKGWNRSVMLEATDSRAHFSLIINDLALTEVRTGLVHGDPPIHLQAEEDVLRRIFTGEYNPAAALMDGVASAADIDTAMKLGTNYPRGPLAWGDLIGLDVVLGVMRGLQEEFGDDRYRPCPLLARYVLAGRLGKKVGRGFFEY